MGDIDIHLPLLEIQQKYVDVYNAMLANQQAYERGLEDPKLTGDAYIEEPQRKQPSMPVDKYLIPSKKRNKRRL